MSTDVAVSHTQTVDGEAFSPVTERIHHHGRDPEAPGPNTAEELAAEVGELVGDLQEAAGILKMIAEAHGNAVSPVAWAVANLSGRTATRLSELSDALREDHTQNTWDRIEDAGTMTLHAAGAADFAWEIAEQGKSSEMYASGFAVASNALDYCHRRLDHLLYEVDLSLD